MSLLQKSNTNKRSFLLMFIVLIAVVFVIFEFVSMQVEISQKNTQLSCIKENISQTLAANEQLERYTEEDNRAEYIESVAREKLDYAYPNERIYYIVPTE